MSGVPEGRTVTTDATSDDENESTADAEAAEKRTEDVRAHLADVADGCGCAEVWEHLSSGRGE